MPQKWYKIAWLHCNGAIGDICPKIAFACRINITTEEPYSV